MRAAWLLLGVIGCGGSGEGDDDGEVAVDAPVGVDAADGRTLFVAQGHAGRTVVSCDGGQSWTADRSDTPAIRCFSDKASDCDHDPGAGRGLGFAGGRFYATFGWGDPGEVRTSDDGVTWTPVTTGTTFGGVAAAEGWVIAAGHDPQVSRDRGATWTATASPALSVWNVRRAAAVAGLAVMIGNDGATQDAVISDDGGVTWWHPVLPGGCVDGDLQTGGGIAGGGGVVVIGSAQAAGVVCRSADGGRTFTAHGVGMAIDSQVVWTGSEFMTWGDDQTARSTDGITWTRAPLSPATIDLGPVAAAGGVLVSVRGGWQTWYEDQAFYRSTDGVTWEVLPAGSFTGGHPIRHIAAGEVAGGSACE